MATPTYELIETTTLSSPAQGVTFSSIDQSYRDLRLIVDVPTTSELAGTYLRFNADSGANYSYVTMFGRGSTATSLSGTGASDTTSLGIFNTGESGNVIYDIMDYSVTDKHKNYLIRLNNTFDSTVAYNGRWADTSAITSIQVGTFGNCPTGTTYSLFGIAG